MLKRSKVLDIEYVAWADKTHSKSGCLQLTLDNCLQLTLDKVCFMAVQKLFNHYISQ